MPQINHITFILWHDVGWMLGVTGGVELARVRRKMRRDREGKRQD